MSKTLWTFFTLLILTSLFPNDSEAYGGTGRSHIESSGGVVIAVNQGQGYTWGNNYWGALCDGSFNDHYAPLPLAAGPVGISDVAVSGNPSTGTTTFMVDQNGQLWGCGHNGLGQLMLKTTSPYSTTPLKLDKVNSIKKVAGASSSFQAILTESGDLYLWGNNEHGYLGIGTAGGYYANPYLVMSNVQDVAMGDGFTIAVKQDGTVWGWGRDTSGVLQMTYDHFQWTPKQLGGFSNAQSVSAGGRWFMILNKDQSVQALGANNSGQLGTGVPNTARNITPVPIYPANSGVVQVSAAESNGYALFANGTVSGWGVKQYAGNGYDTGVQAPAKISTLSGIVEISTGSYNMWAVEGDGEVWALGNGAYGTLGDGTINTTANTPKKLLGFTVNVPPSVPNELKATATPHEVSLSWNPSSGATLYKIYRSPSASGPFNYVSSSGTSAFTDTGLTPDTVYHYRIVASGNGGDSGFSDPLSSRTLKNNDANLISLTLDKGGWETSFTPNTLNYTVWLQQSESSVIVTPTLRDGAATVKVNGVQVNGSSAPIPMSYGANTISVTVTAQNGITTKTYTLTVKRKPANVTNLIGTSNSTTSIDLSWAPAAGASYYEVYLNGSNIATGMTANRYTLTGLVPSTIYEIRVTSVASYTEAVWAEKWSDPIQVKTLNDLPPQVVLSINDDQEQTTLREVTLQINAVSSGYSLNQLLMSFSENGQLWSTSEPYASSKNWTFSSAASGKKNLFIRIIDPSGNSAVGYDSIYYVNTGNIPGVGGSATVGGTIGGSYPTITFNGISNVYVTNSNLVTLDFSGYAANYVSLSTDNVLFSKLHPTSDPILITLPGGDGLKQVNAQLAMVKDENALGTAGRIYFLVDSAAPELSVSGVNGATATSGTSFQVKLNAKDNTTPLPSLQYQVNDGAWMSVPANGRITISSFSAHSGLMSFDITIKDYAGNTTTQTLSFWAI